MLRGVDGLRALRRPAALQGGRGATAAGLEPHSCTRSKKTWQQSSRTPSVPVPVITKALVCQRLRESQNSEKHSFQRGTRERAWELSFKLSRSPRRRRRDAALRRRRRRGGTRVHAFRESADHNATKRGTGRESTPSHNQQHNATQRRPRTPPSPTPRKPSPTPPSKKRPKSPRSRSSRLPLMPQSWKTPATRSGRAPSSRPSAATRWWLRVSYGPRRLL